MRTLFVCLLVLTGCTGVAQLDTNGAPLPSGGPGGAAPVEMTFEPTGEADAAVIAEARKPA